jgi:hypothetical protein
MFLDSAKSKIDLLPNTIPVGKVRSSRKTTSRRPVGTGCLSPAIRWSVTPGGVTDQRMASVGYLTWDDGSGPSPRTVVDRAWKTRGSSRGSTRALQFSLWCPRAGSLPPLEPPGEMVETRRLELLTLSLQRRCSAN